MMRTFRIGARRFVQGRQALIAMFTTFVLITLSSLVAVPAQATPPEASCDPSDLNYSQEMVLEFTPTVSNFTLDLPAQNFSGSVDWGDGLKGSYTGSIPSHGYGGLTIGNTFQVCLLGTATAFGTPDDPTNPNYNPWNFHWAGEDQLTAVSQWGQLGLTNLGAAFNGASNLLCVADYMVDPVIDMTYTFMDANQLGLNCSIDFSHWDTSHVLSMHSMFSGATLFNGDVSTWDVSHVQYMGNMFADAAAFDGDISSWDTSAVLNMSNMFAHASSFNHPVNHDANTGAWDTSHVENMDGMFSGAVAFDQDLNNWDTSSALEMSNMFYGASEFGRTLGNVSSWDTSQVGNAFWSSGMSGMFADAPYFNSNISNWDTSNVTDMSGMFAGATRFNRNIAFVPATGGTPSSWDTGNVTNMSGMFAGATAFNGDITNWHTDSLENASYMFDHATNFNRDISSTNGAWDMSNVNQLENMFAAATAFNGNISSWDTSRAMDMSNMFRWASAFNQDVGGWDTGLVLDMDAMFYEAVLFNQDLSNWDTSQVRHMNSMFRGATAFNGNISTWDVSYVGDMESMFEWATNFNQDISGWQTPALSACDYMFAYAAAFNQDLSGWDVSGVTNMESMFDRATAFNGDVTTWDVSNVDYMGWMFNDASSFNQDLSAWNIGAVTAADWMLSGTSLSTLNYSKLLRSWATQPHQSGTAQNPIVLAVNTDYYNTVEANRQALIDDHWDIFDGGPTPAQSSSIMSVPIASSITVGQPVSASTLSGGMGMPIGTFAFADPSAVLPVGSQSVLVNFTPDEGIAYLPATLMVSLEVEAAPIPAPLPSTNSASDLTTTGIHSGSIEWGGTVAAGLMLLGGFLRFWSSRRKHNTGVG